MIKKSRRRSREQTTSESQHEKMDDNYHYPSSIFPVQQFSLNSFERTVSRKGRDRKPDPSYVTKRSETDFHLLKSVIRGTGRKCSDIDLDALNKHFERYISTVNLVLSDVYSHPTRAEQIGEKLSSSKLHGHAALRPFSFLSWEQDNKFGKLVYERMHRNVLETAARIIRSDYTRRTLVNTLLEVLSNNEKDVIRLMSNKRVPADLIRKVKDRTGRWSSSGFHYALSACKQVRRILDESLISLGLIDENFTELAGRRGRKRQKVRQSIKKSPLQKKTIARKALELVEKWITQGFPFSTPVFKKRTTDFAASTENTTGQGYWFERDSDNPDEIIFYLKTPPGITQKERVPGSPYRNQTLRLRFLNWLPRKARKARRKASEALEQGDTERAMKLTFRAVQFEDMNKQLLNTIRIQHLTRDLSSLRAKKDAGLSEIDKIKDELKRLKENRSSTPPILRVVGNKVTLLISFLPIDKTLLSKSIVGIRRENRAGVDRGLRYPVVISIQKQNGEYVERKIELGELYQKRETLRQQARKLMSQIARKRNNWEKKHPGLSPPSIILKKEREMESVWQKVRRLDKEISHLVASHTTWFCEHHGVETVFFEDLRTFQGTGGMSTHSWNLSTNLWGQIIDGVTYRRLLLGHKNGGIWTVNPAWTSQTCHHCGERGVRVEKSGSTVEVKGGEFFYCENCDYQSTQISMRLETYLRFNRPSPVPFLGGQPDIDQIVQLTINGA